MNKYYVQYSIRNIKNEFLESYFSNIEKGVKNISTIDIKHSFISNNKIYINTHVSAEDEYMAGKINLNEVNSLAINALNYYDEEKTIFVEVEKTEKI